MAEELSPQTVSDLLTKAGFAPSTTTGRMFGTLAEHSTGFIVSPLSPDTVVVWHMMNQFVRDKDSEWIRVLGQYREALAEAGLDAELSEKSLRDPAVIAKRR